MCNFKTDITTMATVVVCPSCRSQLSPCLSVSCPMVAPSAPCENCQRCRGMSAATTPCLVAEVLPHFPLPYVCRHWLQISRSSSCCHSHNCSNAISSTSPMCQATHQDNSSSTEHVTGSTLQIQRLNGPCIGAAVKDLSNGNLSRSGSPENRLLLPDLVFSVAGAVTYPALQKTWTPEDDKKVLAATTGALHASGWYYGSMTWQEAASLLANKPEGTFLVRDSSSKKCPFALSVQTPQGPTSIRIEYEEGKFWLDCEKKGVTPQLTGVIELVDYYRQLALASDSTDQCHRSQFLSSHIPKEKHVWIDHRGRVFSPIRVVSPLKKNPSSLKHLCRLSVHLHKFPESHLHSLPSTLFEYLKQYQYSL